MRSWVAHNHADFERDVLRDFCQTAEQLSEQIARFAGMETVSFSILRALVGEPLNKGPLWRLKDKAHHIFRNGGSIKPPGVLLDWVLGSIFHESLKLMEDAHQRQFYAPQIESVSGLQDCPELAARVSELMEIQSQTVESMRREVARLENLLLQARKLFCLYFRGCASHRPLARFLHDNDVVQRIFADDYKRLIQAVYGDAPERMCIEAAFSLLESARFAAATRAVEAALSIAPGSADALELQKLVGCLGGEAPKEPPLSEQPYSAVKAATMPCDRQTARIIP